MIWRDSATCAIAAAALALSCASCSAPGVVTASINEAAALDGQLPRNPLQWNAITAVIDKRTASMGILYGNDIAVKCARSNSQHDYPAGSVVSLVTWAEQEDPRWFGARIPARVKSVEFVSINGTPANQTSPSYERYEGSPLARASMANAEFNHGRTEYLLSLRAAVMP
jgi:hypothetical protein